MDLGLIKTRRRLFCYFGYVGVMDCRVNRFKFFILWYMKHPRMLFFS